MTPSGLMRVGWCGSLAAMLLLLAACERAEQLKAKRVEDRRVECLDKICEGDAPPKVGLNDFVMKLNGQYFVVPNAYSAGLASLAFYWPSKTPVTGGPDGKSFPEFGQKYSDVAIDIFLTGRQRWSASEVEKPWDSSSWRVHLGKLQVQGLRVEHTTLKPGLDLVRFRQPDDKPYGYAYYVATERQRIRGDGPPVLSCQVSTPPYPGDVCTSGEFWQPDVYADFRFNIKHAPDWPAIHEEIVRVLSLSRKAQP